MNRAIFTRMVLWPFLAALTLLPAAAWSAEARLGWEWNERGIILNAQQIRDIKSFQRAVDKLAEDYRRADEAEDALRNSGNTPLADRVRTLKKKLAEIRTSMPTYAVSRTFAQDLEDYKYERLPKHNQIMREVRREIAAVREELGLTEGGGDGEGQAAPAPGASAGSSRGVDVSGFGFYILEVSGDMSFFINGRKVERAFQWVSADGKSRGDLRALLVGEQRQRSRDFAPTANTRSFTNDDYQLEYTVASGSFNATTDWRVTDESYEWTVRPSNIGGTYEVFDSGVEPVVRNDAVHLQWDRAMTFDISVRGRAEWTPTPSGGRRLDPVTDRGSGRLKFAIGPR